ncbi:MAG: hypothetical protein U0470_04930, partial [Anaerolineae bacterium]
MRRAIALPSAALILLLLASAGKVLSATPDPLPEISIVLHGNEAIYRGSPTNWGRAETAMITGELLKPDGTRIHGYGILAESGFAAVAFGGRGRTSIVPGDTLSFGGLSEPTTSVVIPPFFVDYDPQDKTIFGATTPNQSLNLALHSCDTAWRCVDIEDTILAMCCISVTWNFGWL